MVLWIKGDVALTELYEISDSEQDVVISGRLTSDHDISISVNNLVVIGELISSGRISISTEGYVFNGGVITAEDLEFSSQGIFKKLNSKTIRRIQELGVDISYSPSGKFIVRSPE